MQGGGCVKSKSDLVDAVKPTMIMNLSNPEEFEFEKRANNLLYLIILSNIATTRNHIRGEISVQGCLKIRIVEKGSLCCW